MESLPPDAETLLVHSDFLRALARGLLADEGQADDVVQDTWVAAIEHPPRDRTGLRAWLATVTLNFARRALRAERRRPPVPPKAPTVPTPEQILAREETRRRVVLAVLKLAEPYRSTVVLRFLEELPPREVALRMGVPVETVRTRLKRALAQLRAALDDAYGERKAWSLALLPLALPRRAAGPLLGGIVVTTKVKLLGAATLCALAALLWTWGRSSSPAPEGARAASRAARTAETAPEDSDVATEEPAEPAVAGADAHPEGTTIAGRVLGDGAPLEGACVSLRRGDDLVARVESSDGAGRFAFRESGRFTIVAAHPQRRCARADVTAVEGQRTDVVLELAAAPSMDFRVVDARTGEPVAGAEILVLRSGDGSCNEAIALLLERSQDLADLVVKYRALGEIGTWAEFVEGEEAIFIPPVPTDAAGRATVGGLAKLEVDALVTHPDYAGARVRHGSDGPVVVRLERGTLLTLVGPRLDGATMAGCVCEISRPGLLPMPAGRAVFDEDGVARFTALSPGTYTLALSKHGTWSVSCRVQQEVDGQGNRRMARSLSIGSTGEAFLVRSLHVTDEADQRVDLSYPGETRVDGRIEGASGDPSQWFVRLLSGADFSDEVASVRPDAEGRFAFERVAPGSYRLSGFPLRLVGSAVHAPFEVHAADRTVEVVLRPGGSAAYGVVTGLGDQPLPSAEVAVCPLPGAKRTGPLEPRTFSDLLALFAGRARADGGGAFEVSGLEPGDYLLLCASGNALGSAKIRLAPAGRQRVDFVLDESRLSRVSIRLTRGDGSPVAGSVRLRGEEGGFVAAVMLGRSPEPRTAHVFHLAPGRYRADVYADGYAPVLDLPIDAARPVDTTCVLAPGAPLTLIVESTSGSLEGHDVELVDRNGLRVLMADTLLDPTTTHGRTDRRGRVTFPHVLPGSYVARVDGRDAARIEMGDVASEQRLPLPQR